MTCLALKDKHLPVMTPREAAGFEPQVVGFEPQVAAFELQVAGSAPVAAEMQSAHLAVVAMRQEVDRPE